ncbi:uncharacterized protein LOC119726018 [Patiria miniata]|uniref:Uncharacterized protein n=1 Tax=Patiria miniata TaxID=46514 RepID=A0A913ZQZ6_PATMI|nr:uncharacterized protein LOC119726018 [Patiria miniata]
MPQKTIQDLDAYIKATAAVYDHSNTKLVSRKTKVSRRRKEAFLSVLPYRKPSSHYHSQERKKSSSSITRKPRSRPASESAISNPKQKLNISVQTSENANDNNDAPQTLSFQLDLETSVQSLKELIEKQIGVEARYQCLYNRQNFQLCDLLTLEENDVDKNEIISLRLSKDDRNCNDVPKDKTGIDHEYLKDLSSKVESSRTELAKHLGYEEAEIADFQTTNEGSTEESRHMLLTWWKKTTDRDEAAQKLRRALEAIGLTELAQNVPVTSESRDETAEPEPERRQDAGVDEESKQNGAASTEEEKLKNDELPKDKAAIDDEYLKGLSPKIESSWKELAKHLGYEEAEIADIQTTNEGSTEESHHMLLTWWEKTTDRNEAAQKLRRALEAIGLTDLAQSLPVTSTSRDEAAGPEPERRQDAGVDKECKQKGATSTEEEKLKKEQVFDQDKPQLISRRYLQVFIRGNCLQKPKITSLRLDPETSVLILKVIISEKIGVHPQQQRLFIRRNCRNFELHNLLTLHDCGIHQDENISLRLCTDGLLGGGPKDKHPVGDQFFRDIASKTESFWEQLAKSLGYGEDEIKQFQKICQENKERSLQMLLSWWIKQTNREEGFQNLKDALNSIGRAELALMVPSEEQWRMKQEEVAEREKRRASSEGRGPRQEETAHRLHQTTGTTSSENQRTCQEDVTHRDKHESSVQMRGAQEQSRKRGATSSKGQRARRDEVAHRDKPTPKVLIRGAKEQSRKRRATSSEDQRPEEVTHRDNSQSEVQMGGAKKKIKQNETTSSEDQRKGRQEAAYRDKPQPLVHVGVPGTESRPDARPDDKSIWNDSKNIGTHWEELALNLNSSKEEVEIIKANHSNDVVRQCFEMLSAWWRKQDNYPEAWRTLEKALVDSGRNDLVQGTSVEKRQSSEEPGRSHTTSHETQLAADRCEKKLKYIYTNRGSYVQMLPWVDDDQMHIMDIYTKLQLQKDDDYDDLKGEDYILRGPVRFGKKSHAVVVDVFIVEREFYTA